MNDNGLRSIPSKRFDIWRRLYTRFTLEPAPASGSMAAVGTEIVPFTNVDELLGEPRAFRVVEDLTPTIGAYRGIYSVPTGRRAKLLALSRDQITGDTRLAIRLVTDGVNIDVLLTPLEAPFQAYLGSPVTLNEGDSAGWFTSGNAGDGARIGYAIVVEEEAF